MFLQILFLICSVCNTHGVASTASPSCASDEYRAGQLCCLACPGGYRVHRDCTATANTLCSKCPDDTFKEGLSGQKQCSACTKCVTGQIVKKSCTPTSDAECEIQDGFFCSDSADKDTFSEATLSCQPHTICDSVGGVQIQQGTDSTDSTCLKYVAIAFIIIGCICFIILLVLGALFYRRRKMERDLTEWEKQIDEMETRDQVLECEALRRRLKEKKKTQKQQRKFDELNDRYWENRESLELDGTLTEWEKQIDEMKKETQEQVLECLALWEQLEETKKTPKQERKFDALIRRYWENRESLELDGKLTELEKLIPKMETLEQRLECEALRKQLEEKKKTPKQERKFVELNDLYWEKRETMELNLEIIDGFYRRQLKIIQKENKTLNEWIDNLLEGIPKQEEECYELGNRIRDRKKEIQELEKELYIWIDAILKEREKQQQDAEFHSGAAGEGTSGPSSTYLLSTELPAGLETSIPPAPSSETKPAGLETSIPPAPSSETQPAEETTPLMSSESPESTGDQQEHTSRTTTPDVTMDGHDDDQSLDALAYWSGTGQLDIEMGPVRTLPKDRNRIL